MLSTDASSPRPVPAGAALYAVQDTTLICVPQGASQARYQRVTFTGSGQDVVATANDAIDLGPMAAIRTARAVTDVASGGQEVAVLSGGDLTLITHDGQTSHWTTWKGYERTKLIIGIDPDERRALALLDYDGTDGRFRVTCSGLQPGLYNGIPLKFVLLPHQVRGTAVAAELVHHGSSTMVVIATVQDTDHSLMVHAVAWEDIALTQQFAEVTQVKTLTLGTAVASQVGAAVARMRLGSDDQ
jgi:hypothetical protein